MEFLVDMVTTVPEGTDDATVADTKAREAVRAEELAREGHLLRLWSPPVKPGEWRIFGLFSADDEQRLNEILGDLPLYVWMTIEVTPLAPHPNDPAAKLA
jgi:muconolactone D-isomerase